jgi:hypothetical protein
MGLSPSAAAATYSEPGERFTIRYRESQIAALARFRNSEPQNCREIFCLYLVTKLKPVAFSRAAFLGTRLS